MRDVPLILIVDDLPQNLDLLARRLQKSRAMTLQQLPTARRRSSG